jgi:SAM-dependent methyltransferase
MQRYWDEKAREDGFFFVDERLEYGHPHADRFWREGEQALDELLGRLGVAVGHDDVVVDLGCGLGRLTRVLAARAARVVAIDISPEMLKHAQELNWHLDNVDWVLGDGASLRPLADGSVSAVVAHLVFQHVPDPRVTLGYVAEMGRVLRPGGWAAFEFSNDPDADGGPARGSRLGRLRGLLGRPDGRARCDGAVCRGSAIELECLRSSAEAAGLSLGPLEGAGTPVCLARVVRPRTGTTAGTD